MGTGQVGQDDVESHQCTAPTRAELAEWLLRKREFLDELRTLWRREEPWVQPNTGRIRRWGTRSAGHPLQRVPRLRGDERLRVMPEKEAPSPRYSDRQLAGKCLHTGRESGQRCERKSRILATGMGDPVGDRVTAGDRWYLSGMLPGRSNA